MCTQLKTKSTKKSNDILCWQKSIIGVVKKNLTCKEESLDFILYKKSKTKR